MSRPLPCLAMLSFLGVVSGCAQPSVRLAEGTREYVGSDYEGVLSNGRARRSSRRSTRWTTSDRHGDLRIVGFSLGLRHPLQRGLTGSRSTNATRCSSAHLAETHDKHEFYVALYAQKHKWNDLNAEQPAWIVRLIDDTGTETAPSEIQTIRRPGAIELTYFPYTSALAQRLRISFPSVRADGRATIPGAARWFACASPGRKATKRSSGTWTAADRARCPRAQTVDNSSSKGGRPTMSSCAVMRSAWSTSAPLVAARTVPVAFARVSMLAANGKSPGPNSA